METAVDTSKKYVPESEADDLKNKGFKLDDEAIEEFANDYNLNGDKSTLESAWGSAVRGFFRIANPFKKFAFKTPCLMHRFINIQALHILENEGYKEAASFYRRNIKTVNEGATWIDQDFKSTNHFYHYERNKGLFGFSDALTEAQKYYSKLKIFINQRNKTKSLFYLGVILHLSQDMTVPQHINNRLLEQHRDYEQWILSKAWDEIDYKANRGIERFSRLEDYFRENSRYAIKVYNDLKAKENKEAVYEEMSKLLVSKAQRTTAGMLLELYERTYKSFDTALMEDEETNT